MNKRNVQVQMFSSTVEKVEKLQKTFNSSTKSDAVKTSIDIAEMVADVIANEGEVILKEKDGTERRIILPGVGYIMKNNSYSVDKFDLMILILVLLITYQYFTYATKTNDIGLYASAICMPVAWFIGFLLRANKRRKAWLKVNQQTIIERKLELQNRDT